MKILSKPLDFRRVPGPVVMAAGFFDGIHKGHQLVLASTVQRARAINGQAWVLTFDRHPIAVLAPSKRPPRLTTLEQRLARFEELGMDGALVLEFTRKLAVREPATFVHWLCGKPLGSMDRLGKGQMPLSEIRCGDNWRFGRRATGNPEVLSQFGLTYGFKVVVVPYAEYKGIEISSTRIRYAILEGRMEEATAMLGRPYSIQGEVVRGRGIGHQLGFATANIAPQAEVLPPQGIYAVKVSHRGEVYNGVANLGTRPTFVDVRRDEVWLETHMLDFSGDLYGQVIRVSFLARLREERVFPSREALVVQIKRDIQAATRHF